MADLRIIRHDLKNITNRPLAKRAALLAALCALGQAAIAVEHTLIAPGSKGTFRGRPSVEAVRVEKGPTIDGHLDDDAWRFSQRNMQADDETFDDDHEFQRDRHKAIPNRVDSAGNAPKTYGFTVGDGLATGEVVGGLKT